MQLSIEELKAQFFPPGKYFHRILDCSACHTPLGYRTNGTKLFWEPNCSCDAHLKPAQERQWYVLQGYVPAITDD